MHKGPVKIPTPERLKNIALHYLSKYAASEASLRRVLHNRMRRAAMAHPEFAADTAKQTELNAAIESIIIMHKKTGAVNDALIADMKVASLRRAGKSQRFIEQKLGTNGLQKANIARAIGEHDGEDAVEADTQAALALCKKRKLGAFRAPERRKDGDAQRDFGTLARAGFSSAIIRKVLNTSADDISDMWE